jgi:hypothetical protein
MVSEVVFAKVGVQSRAELVATIYVRHYEPRRGATPGPYGWYLDDNVAAVEVQPTSSNRGP